jgi:hypothetical protein
LSFVFCLLSFVFCLLSFVFRLSSFVFCLLSFVLFFVSLSLCLCLYHCLYLYLCLCLFLFVFCLCLSYFVFVFRILSLSLSLSLSRERYERIRSAELKFTCPVSLATEEVVRGMMDRNPMTRFGSKEGVKDFKHLDFFHKIDWDLLVLRSFCVCSFDLVFVWKRFVFDTHTLMTDISLSLSLSVCVFLQTNRTAVASLSGIGGFATPVEF